MMWSRAFVVLRDMYKIKTFCGFSIIWGFRIVHCISTTCLFWLRLFSGLFIKAKCGCEPYKERTGWFHGVPSLFFIVSCLLISSIGELHESTYLCHTHHCILGTQMSVAWIKYVTGKPLYLALTNYKFSFSWGFLKGIQHTTKPSAQQTTPKVSDSLSPNSEFSWVVLLSVVSAKAGTSQITSSCMSGTQLAWLKKLGFGQTSFSPPSFSSRVTRPLYTVA